jgi:hypothetical protein
VGMSRRAFAAARLGAAVTVVAGVLAATGAAQTTMVIPRVSGEIRVDGRIDEAGWTEVAPLPAVTVWPTAGLVPSERTEFRVAHDDRYIYFSCRNYDRDPDGIRVTSLRRDEATLATDWCSLGLDTYLDRENLLIFGVTAEGQRTDLVVSGDGASLNFTWGTFWDAAATRDADGWSAEGRIPLSSVRFESEDGVVTMGMNIWRGIARKNEYISFPATSDNFGITGLTKASLVAPVRLQGVISRRPMYVTPYGLGGYGRSQVLNDSGTAYVADDVFARDMGLDLKVGLSDNLTLDATVNTDFAQVEADDQQVNLTRFSLFFPERRLFFQERAAVFNMPFGGSDRLFYSRRIGLAGGEPVRIYGGARVVGRLGAWDVGALDMHTDAAAGTGSENFGVLRVRRQVLNANSYVGGMATTRIGEDGSYNVAYGLDAIVRMFGTDYLTVNWAQTFDDGEGQVRGGLGRGLARVQWERRGQDGLSYLVEGARVGAEFRPAMGFLRRRDIWRTSATLAHAWRYRDRPILRQQAGVSGSLFVHHGDGHVQTAEVSPEWTLETASGHSVRVGGQSTYDRLEEAFDLSDEAGVPQGRYTFHAAEITYTPADAWLIRPTTSVSGGTFYDGWRLSGSAGVVWTASRRLQLNATYALNRIRFPDRSESFTSHLARLRVQVSFSRALIATAFVQFNNAADAVVTNLRVRYNPREGVDLYVVVNEGRNTSRDGTVPLLPAVQNRTLLIKYSHTLRFEF